MCLTPVASTSRQMAKLSSASRPSGFSQRTCLPARDTTPMTTWGIISTADINRKLIPGAHESPRVDLVAVASREPKRAEEYAREWGIERAYGSYDALLEDGDVEAVYISLPNTMHCEWSIRALEAGKHVLCENA